MKAVLADDYLKSELQKMRWEIANNTSPMRMELDKVNANIRDMEGGLSTWSDEVVTLQTTVTKLESN